MPGRAGRGDLARAHRPPVSGRRRWEPMKEVITVGLDPARNLFQGPSVKRSNQWSNHGEGRGRCGGRGCRPSAGEARSACAVLFPAATLPDRPGRSPVITVVQRGTICPSPLDDGSSNHWRRRGALPGAATAKRTRKPGTEEGVRQGRSLPRRSKNPRDSITKREVKKVCKVSSSLQTGSDPGADRSASTIYRAPATRSPTPEHPEIGASAILDRSPAQRAVIEAGRIGNSDGTRTGHCGRRGKDAHPDPGARPFQDR